MIPILIALIAAATQDAQSHVRAVEKIDRGRTVSGSDYLLIAEAARHPQMRRANLSCFNIVINQRDGKRWVSFVEARDRRSEQMTAEGLVITIEPPDLSCRPKSFEMAVNGHVAGWVNISH